MNQESDKKSQSCIWCLGALGENKYQSVPDRLGYVKGEWDLIECADCSTLKISPFPSPQEVVNYYPENYNIPAPFQTDGIRKLFSILERWFLAACYKSEVERLYHRLPLFKKRDLKILEIGCGNGNRAEFFHHLKLDITGVDMSHGDVEAVKAKGINALCVDIQSIDEHFEPESFDLIMSFDVLEHIPNLDSFFRKAMTLLKPGGWMVAGLPAQDCFAIRFLGERWVALKEVPRHVSVPSIQGAEKLFHRFGLLNTSIFAYGSLSCAMGLGNSICETGAAFMFYGGKFKLSTSLKRIFGAVTMFVSAPLFFFENHFTAHPSRFVICGKKQSK